MPTLDRDVARRAWSDALADYRETKDRIRTPEGAAKYGQPIGSVIQLDVGHRVWHASSGRTGTVTSADEHYVGVRFDGHTNATTFSTNPTAGMSTSKLARSDAPEPEPLFAVRPFVDALTLTGQRFDSPNWYAVEYGEGGKDHQVRAQIEEGLSKGKRPTDAEIQKTLSVIADLLERFPLVGAHVSVTIESKRTASGYGSMDVDMSHALAFVIYGGPATIHLVEKGFKFKNAGGGFMPSQVLDPVAATVAHEYGHLHMRHRPHERPGLPKKGSPGAMFKAVSADKKMKMSRYGLTNGDEAYAEAFSEWAVSHGETKNPAARAYAEAMGWP